MHRLGCALVMAAASGCSFPAFDFRATDQPNDVGGETGSSLPSCNGGTAGDACMDIVRLGTTQKVDGLGDEFCALPVTRFDKRTAQFNTPNPPPDALDPRAEIRAGWSSVGLHLHVHVIDDKVVITPAASNELHEGDSIEIYAAGFVPTAGDFDDKTDVGAVHVIVSPPGEGIDARAYVYTSRYDHLPAPLATGLFAGRIVEDGYEIELQFPWSLLTRTTPPTATSQIGFTLSVNDKDDPAQAMRAMQMTFGYRSVKTPADSCAGVAPAEPYCDDRTWCLPTLE